MHALTTVQLRVLTALMLALLVTGPLEADSPWSRLTKIISNDPAAPRGRAQQVANGAVAVQQSGDAIMAPAAVPNEGQPTVVGSETQMAALNAPNGFPVVQPNAAPATGLAMEGKGDTLIDLGRESEEDATSATDLFKNPEMLRLLGDAPRFVYDPAGKQDPMLVPWVRNAAIYSELSTKAEELISAGDIDGAVAVFNRIVAMGDPRFSAAVQARLAELNAQRQSAAIQLAQAGAAAEAKIELPNWVVENTTGVIVSPGEEMALVGDHMLKVGDALPNYPEVQVAGIQVDKVTYTVQDKAFEVELKEEE